MRICDTCSFRLTCEFNHKEDIETCASYAPYRLEVTGKRIEDLTKDYKAKADKGKLRISLCPTQIIKDIAQVRMYGEEKYGDPDNWRRVEVERYIDAMLRHLLEFLKDWYSKDEESGIEHYKHAECNMAFISEMMADLMEDQT